MTDTDTETQATADEGWEWAIVEIMGHRKHVGRVREEERFGAKLLRVDVPNNGDPATHGWTTHHYAGSALFGFTLTDEATALRYNKPYQAPYRLTVRENADDFDGDVTEVRDDEEPN